MSSLVHTHARVHESIPSRGTFIYKGTNSLLSAPMPECFSIHSQIGKSSRLELEIRHGLI